MKIAPFIILVLLFAGCVNEGITLIGSTLQVTETGETVTLGAVKMQIFSETKILSYLQSNTPALAAEFKATDQGITDCRNYMKGTGMSTDYLDSCFSKFASRKAAAFDTFLLLAPAPDANALSGADGKFSVGLTKPGKYFIVAKSNRAVSGGSDNMYWIVPFEMGSGPLEVVLSNSNMYQGEVIGVTP